MCIQLHDAEALSSHQGPARYLRFHLYQKSDIGTEQQHICSNQGCASCVGIYLAKDTSCALGIQNLARCKSAPSAPLMISTLQHSNAEEDTLGVSIRIAFHCHSLTA